MNFPGQTPRKLRELLAAKAKAGYAAIVFEYRKLSGFGVTHWDHELVDIAFDGERVGQRGDGFGNVLFHPHADTTLLASLLQLVASYAPAPLRPALLAAAAPAKAAKAGRTLVDG